MAAKDTMEDEEAICFVCRQEEGDDVFCSCIKCSNYYHLTCYVPTLEREPSVDWECLMCKSKEDFAALSTEQTKSSGNMGKRELHISRRLVLEMYGVEDIKTGKMASKAFRKISDLEFESYKKIIKDPIALDLIKDRLDPGNPDQYHSMSEFMSDFRRMFINCRTYWAMNHMSHASAHTSGTIYTKYASLLEKTLGLKMKELTIGSQVKVPESANKQFSETKKSSYYASRIKQDNPRGPRMKIGKGKPIEKNDDDEKDADWTESKEEMSFTTSKKSKVETTRQCNHCDAVYDKLSSLRFHTVKHFEEEIARLLPKSKSNSTLTCPSDSCENTFKEKTSLIEHYAFEHFCTDEDLNGRPYKGTKGKEDSSHKLNKGIEKAKRDMESRYKRRESSGDFSYKKKDDSESRKRDASAEDGDEEEDDDAGLLLRKKKCQEMFEMYGEQDQEQSGPTKIAGLWDQPSKKSSSKDSRKTSKKKSADSDFEFNNNNSGEDNDDDKFDGNNNARSKSTKERIDRVAQYFKDKKDKMGGTPKRGTMLLPDDEGQGYTRQRIRAKYAEEESE